MGELLLCNQMLAAMPYYIEEVSLNVYSLEELSYFIENNVCLLDEKFMDSDLCRWAAEELNQEALAKKLETIIKKSGKLAEFVEAILGASGYCTKESCAEIVAELKKLEQKPVYECVKIRADRYMKNKKYVSAMYEYLRLLQMKELQGHPKVAGLVWHNLGTAYARLFLFAEAMECFQNAFRLSGSQESLESTLYAKACLEDSERPLDKPETAALLEKYKKALHNENVVQFEDTLRQFSKSNGTARTAVWMKQKVFDWQREYRKQCKR